MFLINLTVECQNYEYCLRRLTTKELEDAFLFSKETQSLWVKSLFSSRRNKFKTW